MDEEERNGRELPPEPFDTVISMFNKKIIDIIKDREPTIEEIQLLLSELNSVETQLRQIINELTQNYQHALQTRWTRNSHWDSYSTEHTYRNTYNSYTEQLHFYIPYYTKILNNFKDVVIFTNQNSCLFQVSIKDINFLYSIKDFTYKYLTLVDRMRSRGEEIIEDEYTVMDVYDTDEKYYYGICNGKKIFTPIDNADRLAPNSGACYPLHYLVINDRFMNLLFTTDLFTDNPNITHKLLLFEHGSAEVVKKSIFYDDSEDYSDGDDDDDIAPLRRMPAWWPRDAKKEPFDLFDLFLSKSKNYAEIFKPFEWFTREFNYVWNIFFNLLSSNNKLDRTSSLQNFKYFFIKNDIELNNLHKDINRYITTNTRFTNMKLIDFFMPEIKLLLHRILYDKFQLRLHDNLQNEWDAYVIEYNKPPHTPPQTFLHYLLNVVLSKLISLDFKLSLLSTLDEMTEFVTREMSKYNSSTARPDYSYITKIIDRVIRKFKLEQRAGKLVSKKKNGQKKISRKK